MPNLSHLNKIIRIHERRLEVLEQQRATMGIQTPPHILLEIEDIHAELAKLRAELKSSGASGDAPPATTHETGSDSAAAASAPKDEIFISYAWGGESEQIVDQIDQAFQSKGVTLIRDKRDLGFKGRIQAFMERIGRGKAVIVIISDKYLKSPNCMFELVQIAKHGQIYDRIFPIVLEDAQIYRPVERIKYVQHWEEQIKELDEAMKSVSSANLQGLREEIDQYTQIRSTIAGLTHLLKDTNALTPDMHSQSGFEELFRAIERKLAE
jgi:internalin A